MVRLERQRATIWRNGRQLTTLQWAGTGVGSVTIPPSHTVPAAGSIVEVRYLYAYEGGSLYQPVYLGIRDDIDAGAARRIS
jgi:hypothetical protein